MDMHDFTTTALHEAGHAVAHMRLGIRQDAVSIQPNDEKKTLGYCSAEGLEHVWDREGAEPQALALYAGYAALLAAGYPQEVAEHGAWGDFEQAEQLIEYWGIGTPEEWRAKSVEFMARPENVAAVRRLADGLMQYKTIDGQLIDLFIAVADGEITEYDLSRVIVSVPWLIAPLPPVGRGD